MKRFLLDGIAQAGPKMTAAVESVSRAGAGLPPLYLCSRCGVKLSDARLQERRCFNCGVILIMEDLPKP